MALVPAKQMYANNDEANEYSYLKTTLSGASWPV